MEKAQSRRFEQMLAISALRLKADICLRRNI
jgi:hypothetical protein